MRTLVEKHSACRDFYHGRLDFRFRLIDHKGIGDSFTTQILKEGRTFVAHSPELDVSSCGGTKEKALRNLKEAVRLFLDEAERLGHWIRFLKRQVI